MTATVSCPGCGADVPDVPELRSGNLYVGAAAGCWAAYTELIGRQLPDPALAGSRMLAVDVYMAQHPGVPGRQAAQSVWVHLVGLCLILEFGFDPIASARAKARLAAPHATFDWLEPAESLGPMTVLDILRTTSATEHILLTDRWAAAVWSAWEPHHARIRQRAAQIANNRP
jgi:hypothetical protein